MACAKLKLSIISPLPVTAAAVKSGAGLPTNTDILNTPNVKMTKIVFGKSIVTRTQIFNKFELIFLRLV